MARKKFEEGFKENAILYCKTHSEKTIKACAADLGIGYSTLRRWIAQSEEQEKAAVVEAVLGKDETETIEEHVDVETVNEAVVSEVVQDEPETRETGEKLEDAESHKTEEDCVVETAEVCGENPETVAEAVKEETVVVEEVAVATEEVAVVTEDVSPTAEEYAEDTEEASVNRLDGVKAQLGELIETAGTGVSDAVQLFGLYKKRHELKKVQKKLKKEKERRMKK